MKNAFPVAAAFAGIAVALPSARIKQRSTTKCDQYSSLETGSYIVYNDLWGESNAESGSQCFTVDSVIDNTIAWSTSWTWTGGSSVKSYANVALDFTSTQLSTISSMKTTWDWSYSGNPENADVAWDMFTSSDPNGISECEIMVWLAAIGDAGPISSSYGSDGSATAIGSTTVNDHTFDLYKGTNGDMTVYTFLPSSGEIASWSGDIYPFFTYLIDSEGFSSGQYLTVFEAGTEATTGSDAVFSVSAYSAAIQTIA
ncbi:glycoside hydrolase family 12 protein [Teratosphaeria destructans]|uniref:Glycoside hydrolase family 12 protein n=1 Tax=Teratosphaeria destructans TaxID=418781 RepID=A0A9W7W105_9PEZI|nr:glycoside hydrolase family 12 protein [Teratosphaeria destructans]